MDREKINQQILYAIEQATEDFYKGNNNFNINNYSDAILALHRADLESKKVTAQRVEDAIFLAAGDDTGIYDYEQIAEWFNTVLTGPE